MAARTSRGTGRRPTTRATYAIPEWGLWNLDDPGFVKRMSGWVKTHRRTELLAFLESKAGWIFDLATKPASCLASRRYIVPLG